MERKQHVAVIAVITNAQGEVVMAIRNQPDFPEIHGKLEFPGGGLEFGETPEEAVIREAKEESGLDVEIVRLLPKIYTNYWGQPEKTDQVILISYECRIIGGQLGSKDLEIGGLKFMKPEEIDYSQALPKTKEIIDLLKT